MESEMLKVKEVAQLLDYDPSYFYQIKDKFCSDNNIGIKHIGTGAKKTVRINKKDVFNYIERINKGV